MSMMVFIEGNEEFKLGDEDLEKLNNFSKILKFYILETPIFSTFTSLPHHRSFDI